MSEIRSVLEEDVARAIVAGHAAHAVAMIDAALPSLNGEQLGRAYQLRALAREDLKEWQLVAADYQFAVNLVKAGSYAQYVCALGAGAALERLGERETAYQWYRSALGAAAQPSEPFSGAEAVRSMLLLGESPSSGDQGLIESTLLQAWRLLEMPGQPDLDDPLSVARALIARGATWSS